MLTNLVRFLLLLAIPFTALPNKSFAQSTPDDGWSQWRGPTRDGHITGQSWPEDLSEQHLTTNWSVPLAPSYSGPIVTTARVFVTETKDKQFEVVRALDRNTGEQIWETQWEGSMQVPFFAASNGSWIRATPAFDNERLSSPVVIEGHIYLHLRNQRFVCLDAKSGEERWTTKPFGEYWSMVANGNKMLALDQTGELLLIDASPAAFNLVDRSAVADDAWAHVAVVDNQIFVRDLNSMKVMTWK